MTYKEYNSSSFSSCNSNVLEQPLNNHQMQNNFCIKRFYTISNTFPGLAHKHFLKNFLNHSNGQCLAPLPDDSCWQAYIHEIGFCES